MSTLHFCSFMANTVSLTHGGSVDTQSFIYLIQLLTRKKCTIRLKSFHSKTVFHLRDFLFLFQLKKLEIKLKNCLSLLAKQ